MRNKILALALLFMATPALASVRAFNSSGSNLGVFSDVKCQGSLSCSQVSGKLSIGTTGGVTPVTAASATTITASQCGGTFVSAAAIEMELPEASAVIGCTLTFVVGAVANFTIDPDAADVILLAASSAGDSLIADAIGESIVLRAISATQWAVVGAPYGTWTDSN